MSDAINIPTVAEVRDRINQLTPEEVAFVNAIAASLRHGVALPHNQPVEVPKGVRIDKIEDRYYDHGWKLTLDLVENRVYLMTVQPHPNGDDYYR